MLGRVLKGAGQGIVFQLIPEQQVLRTAIYWELAQVGQVCQVLGIHCLTHVGHDEKALELLCSQVAGKDLLGHFRQPSCRSNTCFLQFCIRPSPRTHTVRSRTEGFHYNVD